MELFKKSDMVFNDYFWSSGQSGDNPKLRGNPDNSLFNKHEGYEVLYLINKLAELWGLKKIDSCNEMEKMIRMQLPSNLRSQDNVQSWIGANWGKY